MTFLTIKADNGKFMGFDILGGERRVRTRELAPDTSANIKTWSENPQKGSPFNFDKCYVFTVKKFTNYRFVRIPMTGRTPWNILIKVITASTCGLPWLCCSVCAKIMETETQRLMMWWRKMSFRKPCGEISVSVTVPSTRTSKIRSSYLEMNFL